MPKMSAQDLTDQLDLIQEETGVEIGTVLRDAAENYRQLENNDNKQKALMQRLFINIYWIALSPNIRPTIINRLQDIEQYY